MKIQKTIDFFFKSKMSGNGSSPKDVKKTIGKSAKSKEKKHKCDDESKGLDANAAVKTGKLDAEKTEVNEKQIIKPMKSLTQFLSYGGYIEEIRHLMHEEWFDLLRHELSKPYFRNMYLRIKEERKTKVIYPPEHLVFTVFSKTPLSKIKAVIVGQDPYHQKGQAMGLSFSVPVGVTIPPSLKNMLKEIKQESSHGNLISWSEQGVFLLNSSLTVEESKPMSHKGYGWETFTDEVINLINKKREKIVFMLWGNFAIKKCSKIDVKKHFILKAGHPSPLSVKYFENCDHFNKCNKILIQNNISPIKWELPQ